MSAAIAVFHGAFGRAALYRLNRPLAPHAHREGHLVFLVGGLPGTVTVEGARHALARGRAVAINPWQPHAFMPGDFAEGALYLTLYLNGRWFRDLATGGGAAGFGACAIPLDDALIATVLRAAAMLAGQNDGPDLVDAIDALARGAFARSWTVGGRTRQRVRSVSDYRIRNALDLMNARVADTCALDAIARDAGMSRPHFYKLFRQNLGVPPNMYLNTLRLECSIRRLVRSHDPVTAIGLDLGFASQASFTRFFSNNVGISPTDYRRCVMVAA